MTPQFIEVVAILACTLFTGAAVYITAVEHPARLSCGVETAVAEWAPSYKRATVMQVQRGLGGGRSRSRPASSEFFAVRRVAARCGCGRLCSSSQ
jgi:hypothetical protein